MQEQGNTTDGKRQISAVVVSGWCGALKRLTLYIMGWEKVAIVRYLGGTVEKIARVRGYELSDNYEWLRIEAVGDDLLIRTSHIESVRISRRKELPIYDNRSKGRIKR